jgi:uncharacterized membrane protein YqiK
MRNLMDRAAELKANADAEIKKIQSSKDLTEVAKGRRNAEIRSKTNEKISAFQSEHYQSKTEMRDTLHRRLFGLGFPLGASEADKASAKLNYRDALFRADTIADEASALRMLGRAQMTGDRELAKAIASVSYERGWHRALDDYSAQSEAIQSNLRELIDYEHNLGNAQIRIIESMSFAQLPESPEETKARMSGTLSQPTGAEIITRL